MPTRIPIADKPVSASWPHCRLSFSVPSFVILLVTVTFWQLPGRTLIWRELQNTGHTVLFAVLAVLALCSYRAVSPAAAQHPLRNYLAAGAICLLGGAAVEVVQYLAGGDADAMDLLRDAAGILVALGFCAGFDPRLVPPGAAPRVRTLRYTLLALAGGLAVASCYPLVSLAWAYHQRAQAFPVILDLAADWSRPFVRFQHASPVPSPGASACGVPAASGLTGLRLEPVRYAGISIIEPQPDWRGHGYLALELFPGLPAPLELTLRIHDARHDQAYTDRFNRVLQLAPGENRIRIPLAEIRDAPAGRRMDMAHIAGVKLFAAGTSGPVIFCTGPLRLE